MLLSEQTQKNPDSSEVGELRKFIAQMMRLQKQLDASYHGNRFIHDIILTAVELPLLQSYLKESMPRASQNPSTVLRINFRNTQRRQ